MAKRHLPEIKLRVTTLRDSGVKYAAISLQTGVSVSQVWRWCNEGRHVEYLAETSNTRKAYMDEYRDVNKSELADYQRDYISRNIVKVRENANQYRRKKYHTNVNFKLSVAFRNRLGKALRGSRKSGSHVRDLGCTIDELINRFEFFWPQYKWENYGTEWEIDHILPLSAFDLTDRKQLLIACNYANLQPLPCVENQRKGGKVDRNYLEMALAV